MVDWFLLLSTFILFSLLEAGHVSKTKHRNWMPGSILSHMGIKFKGSLAQKLCVLL